MKMSKPTKKDTATPKIAAAGRKKKNTPPPTALLNVAACSSLSLEGDDLFSPLTVTGPEMNDSFEESTYDWENASIGEDMWHVSPMMKGLNCSKIKMKKK